jgi:hypothetical protein
MQLLCVPAAYQVTTRSRYSGMKPQERTGANRSAAAARVTRREYPLCPSRVTVRQLSGEESSVASIGICLSAVRCRLRARFAAPAAIGGLTVGAGLRLVLQGGSTRA